MGRFSRFLRAVRPGAGVQMDKLVSMLTAINLLQALAVAGLLAIFVFNPRQGLLLWLMAMVALTIAAAGAVSARTGRKALTDETRLAEMETLVRSQDELNRRLRMQRHDFINHIQVIYSLLQMQEQEKAQEYLQQVYHDLEKVGDLLKTQSSAVNGLLAAKSVQAQKRSLELQFAIQSPLDHLPMEDWEFCRILGNLLDNAMDAAQETQTRPVELKLWEDIGALYFSVTNHGPAIPGELRERIFLPGFTTKGERGTGMGLAIVEEIMAAHGGEIMLTSDEGATCFSGRLPKAPARDISA